MSARPLVRGDLVEWTGERAPGEGVVRGRVTRVVRNGPDGCGYATVMSGDDLVGSIPLDVDGCIATNAQWSLRELP